MYMSDWNSLTNDEKRERLENLEVAPVAAAPVAEEEKKEIENPEEVDDVPLAAAAAAAVSHSRPSPYTPPEEVERGRREWARKIQREKLEEKRWREKIKERDREIERQRNAAEPGKSTGYIDSQLRRRYYSDDRVIVLFTGDDPPKWYKGTIDLKRLPKFHKKKQWYYVVFDDGDERWIEYKNNNIRCFGVQRWKKVEGLVPGQRVRNKVTKLNGIILEGANRSNMIKVKVIRPDNSHFIQYWTKSQTAISPWRGGGTQRKTKRRTKKRRKKKKRKTRRKTTHRRKHRVRRRRRTRRR